MNTNPLAKRILCYGDSYTYGSEPLTGKRLPSDVRWTCILQNTLGNDFEIVENGIGGRTTNLDDPNKKYRNGLESFYATAIAAMPLDLIVLFLGTNDLKGKFNRSAKEAANVMREYKEAIRISAAFKDYPFPKVLLIAPPILKDKFIPLEWEYVDGEEKSKQFAKEYEGIAKELNFEFIDASQIVEVTEIDGTHLDKENHKKLAKALSEKVKTILN